MGILADRVMKARRPGTCQICHHPISIGQQIGRIPIGWAHTSCIIDTGHAHKTDAYA